MRAHAIVAAVAAWFLGASAPARSEDPAPVVAPNVLSEIHRENLAEIAMGELAAARGGSAELRRFGDRLVRDHRLADRRIIAYARSRGIPLGPPDGPPEDREAMRRALEQADELEFDRAFLMAMVEHHEKDIRTLTAARHQSGDRALRTLVVKLIPLLEQHRSIANILLQEPSV
jgi:putative membrane protein